MSEDEKRKSRLRKRRRSSGKLRQFRVSALPPAPAEPESEPAEPKAPPPPEPEPGDRQEATEPVNGSAPPPESSGDAEVAGAGPEERSAGPADGEGLPADASAEVSSPALDARERAVAGSRPPDSSTTGEQDESETDSTLEMFDEEEPAEAVAEEKTESPGEPPGEGSQPEADASIEIDVALDRESVDDESSEALEEPPAPVAGDAPAPPVTESPDGKAVPGSTPEPSGTAAAQGPPPSPPGARARRSSQRPPPPPSPGQQIPAPPSRRGGPRLQETAPAAETKTPARPAKGPRQWWERFFSDDYLHSVRQMTGTQVKKQCDFIESSLMLPKGATILDVGCGLGLHAVELSTRGYLVVGLDLSLPMITRAAEEAQYRGLKINFLHADIRKIEFEGAFDGVICMGTTFGFFDDESNRDVLKRLYGALRPGGRLILDVVNRDFVIRSQPNLVWFQGDGCVCMEESEFNYFTSRLHVKRTMMHEDGRQSDTEYSIRLYPLHELGSIMRKTGFRVIEVSGQESTRGMFFGMNAPRVVALAERAAPRPKRSDPARPPRNGPGSAEVSESAPATGATGVVPSAAPPDAGAKE
jgi:SAM-dependent methyltransferase